MRRRHTLTHACIHPCMHTCMHTHTYTGSGDAPKADMAHEPRPHFDAVQRPFVPLLVLVLRSQPRTIVTSRGEGALL